MTVNAYGNLDAVMTELIANIGQRLAGLDQQVGKGRPQVMHPDFPQLSFFKSLVKDPPSPVVSVQRISLCIDKYPVRDRFPALFNRFPSALMPQIFQGFGQFNPLGKCLLSQLRELYVHL